MTDNSAHKKIAANDMAALEPQSSLREELSTCAPRNVSRLAQQRGFKACTLMQALLDSE